MDPTGDDTSRLLCLLRTLCMDEPQIAYSVRQGLCNQVQDCSLASLPLRQPRRRFTSSGGAAMRMRKRKAVTERHERAYKGNLMALLATSLAKGVCLVFTLMKFRNCLYLINWNKKLRFPAFWLDTQIFPATAWCMFPFVFFHAGSNARTYLQPH